MTYFATLFDKNYLTRGIALWESLHKNSQNFLLYVLCLDDYTFDFFTANHYKGIEPIRLSCLEKHFPILDSCKKNRNKVEYYFTLSPFLPLYLLETQGSEIEYICSIDADLYFYNDPQLILKDFNKYSILITSHSFSPNLEQHWFDTGIFNVSFQAFRNNKVGLECLHWWKEQCVNWCYNHYDALYDRFADQKYLEEFADLFGNEVLTVDSPSANVALWNVNQYKLKIKNDILYSNGLPLVFYHFSNVKILNNILCQTGFYWAHTRPESILINNIYLKYINRLKELNQTIHKSPKDIFLSASNEKRWAEYRLMFRERGLLLTFDSIRWAIYINFSWLHDFYSKYQQYNQSFYLKRRREMRKNVATQQLKP